MFAKEYGWSKRQILEEVYIEEVEFFTKRIKRERASQRMVDLAIEHNPHTQDPNNLVQSFKNQLNEIDGKSYLQKEQMTKEDERQLKEVARRMQANSKKRRNG